MIKESKPNKSVLITGSSRGLGLALAYEFAKKDYSIIIHGRNAEDLDKAREEINSIGGTCYSVKGDVRSTETHDNLYRAAQEIRVSVLVNNAAVHCPNLSLEKLSSESILEIVGCNLLAPIMLTHKIYPIIEKGGTIINIGSILGIESRANRTAYCASKWGLKGFTDSLREEARKNGIRVVGVYPTRIKTQHCFAEGMDPSYVAGVIYNALTEGREEIIIDDRVLARRSHGK